MDFKMFTKRELGEILDVIQQAVACRNEKDVILVVDRLKNMICAERGVCALGEVKTGKLLKIVNINWPTEWAEIYTSEELYRDDPIIRYNYEFFKTHTWTEAVKIFSDDSNIDIMNRASEFGLKYGLSSGVNGTAYKGSIFSFSSDRKNFDSYHMKILDIITPHIHQALSRISDCSGSTDFALSAREMEVLGWMKAGKTNWEISVILGISERTVKFHVQNIEKKLNAVNKAHAIAIAMDTGLVV